MTLRGRLVPVACLAFAPSALAVDGAEVAPEPVRFFVDYRAHGECPTAAEFQRGVASRARSAAATDEPSAEVRLEVTLASESGRTTGVLVVTLPDGSRSERRVGDASCEAAAASLAVMSALVLDAPRGAAPPEPAEAPEPAEPPPPSPRREAPAPRVSERAPVPAPRRTARAAPTVAAAVRAGALWESAVAPGVPLGALAGGELSFGREGLLAPAVGVSVLATLSRRTSTSAGAASFRLMAARLSGCPVRLGLPYDAALRACVELDAGALRGEADPDVPNHGARTMPWLAAGAGVRAELPLAGGLALEASGAGRRLARHDRFVFRPTVPVYDVPPWSAALAAGLSYTF